MDRIRYVIKTTDFQDLFIASAFISFGYKLVSIQVFSLSACIICSFIWSLNFTNINGKASFIQEIDTKNPRYQLYEFQNDGGLILTSLEGVYVKRIDARPTTELDAGRMVEIDAGRTVELDAGPIVEIDAGLTMERDAQSIMEIDAQTTTSINAQTTTEIYKPLISSIEKLQIIQENQKNSPISSQLNSLIPGQFITLEKCQLWPNHISNENDTSTLLIATESKIQYLLPELEELYFKRRINGKIILLYGVQAPDVIGKKFLDRFSCEIPQFTVKYLYTAIAGTAKKSLENNWIQGSLIDMLSKDLIGATQEIFIATDHMTIKHIQKKLKTLEIPIPEKIHIAGGG